MKTNVIMHRDMGGLEVTQRTKDGMFNATTLLKEWNSANPKKKKEKVQLFFNNDKTKDFIEVLDADLNGKEITHLSTRGKNGGTWMHPYLFMKFAMWLNPKFELQVIKFVYDQLIENRHIAGDNYKLLSSSVGVLDGCDFSKMAKGLNWIVFGKHFKGIRNSATEDQLVELNKLQGNLAYAIDSGFIKTFDSLLIELRRLYNEKWNKQLSA